MSDNLLKIVQVSYNEYAHRYILLFFFLIIITVLSYKGIFRVFNFITLAYVYKYYKNDQMTISYLPYLVCKIRLSLLNHNLKSTFLLPETNTGSTCKLSAPIKCKKNKYNSTFQFTKIPKEKKILPLASAYCNLQSM